MLDAPIRDIVQQVLRESGYASPAEVQGLRDEARDLRGRLDAVDRRAADLVRMLEDARSELSSVKAEAQSATARPVASDPRVAALESEVASLRARVAELAVRPVAAPAAAPAVTAVPRGGCKVSGCAEVVRSKGFCSAHYQQWRRGTLKGFVGLDGTATLEDGSAVTVPASYAGGAISRKGSGLVVEGRSVSGA